MPQAWHILKRGLSTLAMLLLLCGSMWAQVPDPTDDGEPIEEPMPDEQPITVEGIDQDTSKRDSIRKLEKKVRIRTLAVDPLQLIDNLPFQSPVSFNLGTLLEPDLLWRQNGFSNWLGQIGKPYRRNVYGVESAFFQPAGLFFNPYTGAEDVHVMNPESGMPFYDTRTPYVNVYYGQGKADLAQLRVDVSQNIHPFINISFLYYRRNSSGVYKNFSTGHDNLGITLNGHTRNERYHAFLSTYFHEGEDEFNGGVEQRFAFDQLFFKSVQPVALTEALLRKNQRSVHFRHTVRITGNRPKSDTTLLADSTRSPLLRQSPHSLRLYNSFLADNFFQQYTDTDVDSTVNGVQFPVYPTFGDSSFFYERYFQSRLKGDVGLSYRFKLRRLETGHRVELAGERISFEKNQRDRQMVRFTNSWHGDLRFTTLPFEVRADARVINNVNTLFNATAYAELGGVLAFPKAVVDYTFKDAGPLLTELDSIDISQEHRPFVIEVRTIASGRNPTMQQSYGSGWAGNDFSSDSTLRNTRFEHLRAGLTYYGKSSWKRLAEIPGNEIGVTAFLSRLSGLTYYDAAMDLQQAAPGNYLQYIGLEGRFRIRLGKFFLEDKTTYQVASSPAGLDTLIGGMQPNLYGKASVYFESRTVKVATAIRIGIDYYYHLGFYAPLFDSPSQQFYPQRGAEQTAYHRLDAYFGTQVKRAYIFIKFAHANEGLFAPGYFTTLLHPMLDRTFMVGLNWTFFD